MSVQELLSIREEEMKSSKQKGVAALNKIGDCLRFLRYTSLGSWDLKDEDIFAIINKHADKEKPMAEWAAREKIVDEMIAVAMDDGSS